MMVPNNYQINVSKNKKHYCRIELPNSFDDEALKELKELRSFFPEEFELTLNKVVCYAEKLEG